MSEYVLVALNKAVPLGFTYHVPPHLAGMLQPGHLVRVPFRTGQEAAIVVACNDTEPEFATKPVLELLDPDPVVQPLHLSLAQHIAETLLAPIGSCVWLMVPPGFAPRSETRYHLLAEGTEHDDPISAQLLSLLARRGPLRTRQLQHSLGAQKNWLPQIKALVKAGAVGATPVLSTPTAKPKIIRAVQLAISPDDIPAAIPQLGKESKRANVVEVLLNRGPLSVEALANAAGCTARVVKDLHKSDVVSIQDDDCVTLTLDADAARAQIITWRGAQPYIDILYALAKAGGVLDAPSVYAQTGTEARHLNRLQRDDWIVFVEAQIWRDPLDARQYETDTPPELTPGQAVAWERLQDSLAVPGGDAFLLHGVTGSGKTEIYLRAVQAVLAQGRSAVVLVPEIALTPQMVARFMARFPGLVGLAHSTLSPGERYDTWRRARRGDIRVVIGARSALFTPLPDVGLVVLDEEHDSSYKQSPPVSPPYYHARQVAIDYMQMAGGTVILGSATPDLVTYYRAQNTDYHYLHLPDRVTLQDGDSLTPRELPPVQMVDMRQELRMGHTSIFSRALQSALRETLDGGYQVILFLNKRGSASFVFCRDCGYIHKCPRCDTPLTYHHKQTALKCHHCGHHAPNPDTCPECESKRIKFFGGGTERVVQLLQKEFPGVRALRWDRDTTTHKDAHAEIYTAFAQHEADVLVGTQMVAKGLDLPKVTLVGVISADTSLGLPDYRAGEVTFQLVTQVAGRAGRGLAAGRVFLQTYQPENYAIQAAAEHDYQRFYGQEIIYRRQHTWPPYTRLGRVLFLHSDMERVTKEAGRVAQQLKTIIRADAHTASEVIGPVPCFFERLDNIFRYHIIVRSPDPAALLRKVDVGSLGHIDIDPLDIL